MTFISSDLIEQIPALSLADFIWQLKRSISFYREAIKRYTKTNPPEAVRCQNRIDECEAKLLELQKSPNYSEVEAVLPFVSTFRDAQEKRRKEIEDGTTIGLLMIALDYSASREEFDINMQTAICGGMSEKDAFLFGCFFDAFNQGSKQEMCETLTLILQRSMRTLSELEIPPHPEIAVVDEMMKPQADDLENMGGSVMGH